MSYSTGGLVSKYWASRWGFSGRWAHESSMTGTGGVPEELVSWMGKLADFLGYMEILEFSEV